RCRVIVKEGTVDTRDSAFLKDKDRKEGVHLACMTRATSDLVVEIPLGSQMRRGSKIAVGSKFSALYKIVERSCEGENRPVSRKVFLKLPPPDLDDSISDVERLKRELDKRGYAADEINIDLPIIRKLGGVMREKGWTVTVTFRVIGGVLDVTDVQPGDTTQRRYGAAVDVGTTSLVVYLVDLFSGKVVDYASTYNPQVRCGEDIISRIVYAAEVGGLEELQGLVVGAVNELIEQMAVRKDIAPEAIDNIVISGNTTMTHLFYGVDPSHIREEPYIPTATFFPVLPTKALGLNVNEFGLIYSTPGVASYVGGDISAGILASRMYRKPELALFIDIGTNGEIVVGNSDWMVTAACSAGPAFEGGGVKFGMRAMDGAIEKVAIDQATKEARYAVIGNVPPSGICGSGMIDLIAEMFLTGVIDQRGKLNMDAGTERVRAGEDGPEYVLVWAKDTGIDNDIAFTEPDIENIIRTKGAIYAGIATLLGEVGHGVRDLDKVYIAGGFGNYLDVERAITIGLLPDLPLEKFEFLGNTSIMGAYMALISKNLRKDVEEVARKMTYMELSVSRHFMDEYVSALFLPHTDASAFPTVERMREVGRGE
ncbi:MAG TPA: ASKHA domain-containing protein, partial [Nitrospirota bacterium]